MKGFTLTELLILIAAVAVLSLAVGYRYFSKTDYLAETAYDQLVADIRSVQLITMGQLAKKTVQFYPGTGEYFIDGERKRLPEGTVVERTTLPGNALVFNTLGEPDFPDSHDRYIYLSGGKAIRIYAVTGKIE
ncbi:MAG: hypothetical protein RMJ39_02740 [Deltaproteobacteria bacterium]|nr:hypothetical protein [Deltaproteobacteria bacterium]